MIGEGEVVLVGTEQEGEAVVLIGDEVAVVALVGRDLEDAVPVAVLVVNPLLAGEQGVGYGDDLLGLQQGRVTVSGPGREGSGP